MKSRQPIRSRLVTCIACLLVFSGASSVVSKPQSKESRLHRSSPIFIFHDDEFWLNLHHFLYVLGRAENKTRDSFASSSECRAVSWNHVNKAGGFLDRLNASEILAAVNNDREQMRFRLPSETEWEYAARGGPAWKDALLYSGSDDPDKVAWYGPRWTLAHDLVTRVFGWRLGWPMAGRVRFPRRTRAHEVALKAPNQLGIYDMSGNVWEWCQDVSTNDLNAVPADGSAYVGLGDERRLRGGCHHNWNLHCTASWRYGIGLDAHDGCIGFRVVLATG